MNILYIAHRLPYPPNKGEKIRSFHQLKQLSKTHRVHVCSFVDDPQDLPHVTTFRRHCASLDIVYRSRVTTPFLAGAALLKRRPMSVELFHHKAFASKVLQRIAAERCDCVIVSSSSMAQYAAPLSGIPKIVDFIDVDSEKWRSYAKFHSFPLSLVYKLESERLANYEEEIANVFDHCLVISDEERRILKRASNRPLTVISNGVDLDYFSPFRTDFFTRSRPIIVFTGVMDYFPNVDAVEYFCQEVFPLVRKSLPSAQFYIVGRNPVRRVRNLSKQPNVNVTGAVRDLRLYLTRARVSVAPFRIARGVQNKVLESMAMGIPVVGTVEAFKGIAATEKDGIRIANDAFSFAQHVLAFLCGDAKVRSQAGRQGRRYVESHHQWKDQGAKLERVLQDVVSRAAEATGEQERTAAHA